MFYLGWMFVVFGFWISLLGFFEGCVKNVDICVLIYVYKIRIFGSGFGNWYFSKFFGYFLGIIKFENYCFNIILIEFIRIG